MEASLVAEPGGALRRAFALLRFLGEGGPEGLRLTGIAEASGLPRPSVHRLLRAMAEEGLVDYDPRSKRYTLGLDLFALAARAGNPRGLREICRPLLLRLTVSLGETLFLLVHNAYDAVCIDRSAGPWPIRSFTGDIGGRVPLGVGQGATAILAFLPVAEQEEIMRHNLPRMRDFGGFDEASLRAELLRVRAQGHADCATGLIPGMAGLGVPILDREGRAIAALSVGTTIDRLGAERRCAIAALLKRAVTDIAPQVSPFDPVLRRAGAAME
jgi:DNA-binding IclR family transcriptional regulator